MFDIIGKIKEGIQKRKIIETLGSIEYNKELLESATNEWNEKTDFGKNVANTMSNKELKGRIEFLTEQINSGKAWLRENGVTI